VAPTWSHDPTLVSENYIRARARDESSYLPDVYGVQLLPPSHLKRRGDLSGWHT